MIVLKWHLNSYFLIINKENPIHGVYDFSDFMLRF